VDELRCTAWPNNGDVWGIRIGKQNRRRFAGQQAIVLDLAGELHEFEFTPAFWTNCPSVRAAVVRDWLHSQGVTHDNRREFDVVLRRRGGHWVASVERIAAQAPG
jgi:hypothetical protein